MENTKQNYAEQQARAPYETLARMVEMAGDDFWQRFEELTDNEDAHDDLHGEGDWTKAYPTDAEELAGMRADMSAYDIESAEQAQERIQDDPLSIEVRSAWQSLDEPLEAAEFNILLCTGGPAVRIRGELNQYREPCRAWMESQDWGTPWAQYFDADQETLLAYCRYFYFGE